MSYLAYDSRTGFGPEGKKQQFMPLLTSRQYFSVLCQSFLEMSPFVV